MSRHWALMKEAGALRGMRFMVWIHSVIGRRAFSFVLIFVMAYFYLRRGSARRASMEYLARVKRCYPEALGDRSIIALSFCHFFTFGQSLLDKQLAWAETPTSIDMDPAESEMLFAAAESGRGCLLIGSHFGNLEYSRAIAHRHPRLIVNVLVYDQHAEKFAALIAESDPESRMHLIQVTELDFHLALQLQNKVQDGEWVMIAGDRVPVSGKGRTCDATFFGDKASFPIGPYVLANLLRCQVYLLHCFKIENDHHLAMEFFEEEIRLPRGARQRAYEIVAQKFANALEKQVARAPLQWFNFYDFWGGQDQAGI
jgi:predicted LPLAT superfamily acyltransferase